MKQEEDDDVVVVLDSCDEDGTPLYDRAVKVEEKAANDEEEDEEDESEEEKSDDDEGNERNFWWIKAFEDRARKHSFGYRQFLKRGWMQIGWDAGESHRFFSTLAGATFALAGTTTRSHAHITYAASVRQRWNC